MTRYLIKRTFGALLVMFAVATLVFFMLRLVPGDPIAAMLFDAGDPDAAEEIRRKLGLDQPMYVQYVKWLWLAMQGDFGNSIYGSRVPVSQLIAATRKNSKLDYAVTLVAFLGLSMPDFWLAILLIIVFAANLQWLPAIGYVPLSEGFWPWFSHLILPAIAVGTAFAAIVARMIRSSMLEVLNAEYMQVARAKGLSEMSLILRHAFPNALIPVITVIGIAFALLMSGAVVVENVFAIKGLGRLLIQSILNRDYPVVQATILIVSAIFVFSNLLVDFLYTIVDPRIRYQE